MYEQYYGLDERPFDLSPNPRFLFLSSGHREALNHLRYGLTGRPGVTLVVGEPGTGKTTLVKAALEGRANHDSIVHLSNPTLTRSEFFDYLASGFGLDEKAGLSKSRFLRELESALTVGAGTGTVLALVVDEAQGLPDDLLEEIRLLTNIDGPKGYSLAVALVGQPALATRLNHSALRQLKQRVALRCELTPLDLQETAAYIAARIRVAGGNAAALFSPEAVKAIYERSSGIPRSISVICDNALMAGFALDRKPVERDIVVEVCRDFELGRSLPPVLGSAVADRRETSQSNPLISSKEARAAIAEVRDLDPECPDTAVELARDAAVPTRGAWRSGPWLAAAAIFSGALLAATWLWDTHLLVSPSLPSVSEQSVAGPLEEPSDHSEPTPTAASFETAVATRTVAGASDSTAKDAVNVAPFQTPPAGDLRAVLPLGESAGVPAPQVLPPPPVSVAPAAAPVPLQPAVSTDVVASVSDVPRVDAVEEDVAKVDDEELVRQTLQQYRTAYDGLNVRLAQAVWPGVNETALERAFDGLTSQRLTFDTCDVQLRGTEAAATCRGSARYVPKIGSREPRVDPRVWNFTLRKVDAEWKIETARTF